MVSAILLAAGASLRMGYDKLLLPLSGKPILFHCIENILLSKAKELVLVLRKENKKIISSLINKNIRVIINSEPERGISSSLILGWSNISSESKGGMIMLGDMPFISFRVIDDLISKFLRGKKGIVYPVYKGKKGHPVILDKKYDHDIKSLRGDEGARSIVEKNKNDVEEVEVNDKGVILDIDNYKDYIRLKDSII